MSKLTETRIEIVYRYIHPVSGEMLVRCGGCRDMSVTDCASIIGTHQDISDIMRLERDKFAERRLAEQNMNLRREQVIQENYYRDLLDVQSCGLLTYTLPSHRVIHMNKEALRMYNVKDIREAQKNLGTILKKVYYPEKETIEKLKRLRDEDVVVDYECIINKDSEKECHAMAKTKSIYLPSGERVAVTTFLDVLLENEITRKCLKVTRHIDITHQNVLCDTMKLREILMNLMSNAVKYTPTYGSVDVNIEELSAAEPNHMLLRIAVADSGIGINKEYIPHLFEAFSRERNTSESGIMGTGLGLRIVKSFVELMNGTVTVESTQGKGSCFTVEIPLKLALAENSKPNEQQKPEISLKGKRILLVEDNALNAEITLTILSDAGIQVEIAENGEIALYMLRTADAGYYDLIIMDIQMPVMNGYQAVKMIRKLPDSRSKIPIIAMTANAFEEDRRAAFEAGMNGYAAKPIEIEKLMRIIAETIN